MKNYVVTITKQKHGQKHDTNKSTEKNVTIHKVHIK